MMQRVPSRVRFRPILLVALAFVVTGCSRMVVIEPLGTVELHPPAETSVVVAGNGAVLAELHAEQDRDPVPLDRVPTVLRDAVIAVEDTRFWRHGGVDLRALARALVENAREGKVTQGGSTITQQLAKNAVVGDEQTIERKLEEASVALQLEAQLSKEEILEQYLNTVYFGNGAYGVQTAAQRYFGVDVDRLTLPQAALLAGLLRAPATYDPYTNPEGALSRRNLVLSLMRTQGVASAAHVEAARAAPVGVIPPEGVSRWESPYFVAHVLKLLQHDPEFAVLGSDPIARADRIFRRGLRIETTLDPAWQASAEAAVAETLPHPDDPRGAIAAVHPGTGEIRALVGGRDYHDPDDPQARFNLATDGTRQPGSTFKPLVLAAALAQGRSLDETFYAGPAISIPFRGDTRPWEVRNYEHHDFGELTLRQATAWSVNVVYAQLMADVGPEAVVEMAHLAGITRPLHPYPSLALGAQEVSVLEMATVQATLATGGIYHRPTAVRRIVAADGEVVYDRGDPIGSRVMDESVAWQTTTALETVVSHGTGERAYLHRPMAGKTGTTQDLADAWFVGYTPDLAAAVWIGFPEGRIAMRPPRTRIPIEGGNWPAELFARFALRALVDTPANQFALPEAETTRLLVDVTRNCLPNPFTPPEVVADRAYLSGTEPTEVCLEPTGPPTLDVPDAAGMSIDEALRLFSAAGFLVKEQPEFSAQFPPGYVVRQHPQPGPGQTLDDTGYVVTVWVSSADRTQVAVPDVLTLPADEATALLEEAGFIVEVVTMCPDGTDDCAGARFRPGRVWEQSPDVGFQAYRHTTVRISVYPG
jgi:membrane peptidoglycan carboxypeptidase